MPTVRSGLALVAALVLFAVTPSDAVAGKVKQVPGPPPPPPVTEQDVLDANRDIYEALFGVPWNLELADYDIEGIWPYAGETGSFTGTNELGMPFALDVTSSEVVDLTQLGLTPSELAYVQSGSTVVTNVEATISTSLASFEITAKTTSFIDTYGTPHAKLTIGYYANAVGTLLAESGEDGQQGELQEEGYWKLELVCVTITYPCLANTPECNDCVDDYQDRLDEIQNDYDYQATQHQNALNAAQANHANCVSGVQQTYLTAAAAIEATYVAAMAACAYLTVWAPACMLTATATATALQIGAAVTAAIATAGCNSTLQTAQQQYNANMTALNTWAANERAAAEAEYEECLDDNGCNMTCTDTYCFWVWEWCPY